MNQDTLETTIYADYATETVRIENHTNDIFHLAFGINKKPTWEEFQWFLEDRCPPRTRQNIKEILRDLDVQYYDPILICEKTEGRCADDNSWMDIIRDESSDWEQDER